MATTDLEIAAYLLQKGLWIVFVMPLLFAILAGIIEELHYTKAWLYAAFFNALVFTLYAFSLTPFSGQLATVALFACFAILFLFLAAKSEKSS